jgi:Outer membrane protein (OmpH-like).
MKRILSSLLLTFALLASAGAISQLMAQPAQPVAVQQATQYPLVVVDYAYLMEIHPKLSAEVAALEANFKQKGQAFQQDIAKLQEMEKEVVGLQPGTLDYTQKVDQFRRRQSDLGLQIKTIEEQMQLERIRVTYDAYAEIKLMIEELAKRNNINVVINYLDVIKRLPEQQTVQTKQLELFDEPVILWRNPAFDITSTVESMLVSKYTGNGKPYAAVNYNEVKARMLNSLQTGSNAAQGGTSVAAPGGQPIRN